MIPEGSVVVHDSDDSPDPSVAPVVPSEGMPSLLALSTCWPLKTIRLPVNVQVIGEKAFASCWELLSVELPPEQQEQSTITITIHKEAFLFCRSLRNIVLPKSSCTTTTTTGVFDFCTDLQTIFRNESHLIHALQHRLDDLPIHRICYYQSYDASTEMTIQKLRKAIQEEQQQLPCLPILKMISQFFRTPKPNLLANSNNKYNTSLRQDCFGMTPLHILALSSKQATTIKVYDLLIQQYPADLITKDKWGDLPIHYAYKTMAPIKIVNFLLQKQKENFPDHSSSRMEWERLIERMCLHHHASLETIQLVLKSQQTVLPEQQINVQQLLQSSYQFWKTVPLGIIQLLIQHHEATFPDQPLVWKRLFRRLKRRTAHEDLCILKIQFLVHKSIEDRILHSVSHTKWQKNIWNEIQTVPHQPCTLAEKKKYMDDILFKLAKYELREIAALLELALWKIKLQEELQQEEEEELTCETDEAQSVQVAAAAVDQKSRRRLCQVNCRADVVISNVLPFLGDDTKKRRRRKRIVDYVMNEV